jgi:hypothetical protein
VALTQRDEEVHAFLPECANEPLTQGIRLGTLGWRFEDPESKVVYVWVEVWRENAVAVMQ